MAKYVYERWDYFYEVEHGNPSLAVWLPKLRRVLKNGELEETITASPEPMSAYYVDESNVININRYNSGNAVDLFTGEPGPDPDISFLFLSGKTKNDIMSTLHPTVLIDEIIAEEGTYPDNGIDGDYWYIKTRKAFPDLHIKVNGELRKVQSAWVKVGGHTTPELPEGHREYIAYSNSPDGVQDFSLTPDGHAYVGLHQGLDPDDYRGEGENLIKNSIFPVKKHPNNLWEGVLVDTPFGEHTIGKYTVTQEPVTSSLIRVQNAIPDVGEYTLSYWARTANQGEKANIMADIADLPPWTTTEITSEWKQYSITSNVTSTPYRHADIGIRSLNVPVYLAFWKLEKGSTATPWTPAPADILADINDPSSYTWMSKSLYNGVLKEIKDIYVKKDGQLKKGI